MKKTIVIKIGGALVADSGGLKPLWDAIKQLQKTANVVVVHGGAPQANALAKKLGHTPTFVQGRRITSDLDLNIVKWSLRGSTNLDLVTQALSAGVQAVGLSGVDGNSLQVTRRPDWEIAGEMIDFGWVGDVQRFDSTLISTLLDAGIMPIMSPLGRDQSGQIFNVNADTVSLEVAKSLSAEQFYLVTEAGGVRKSVDDPESRIEKLDEKLFEAGKSEGWIAGGMLVKVNVGVQAKKFGVKDVFICRPADVLNQENGTQII